MCLNFVQIMNECGFESCSNFIQAIFELWLNMVQITFKHFLEQTMFVHVLNKAKTFTWTCLIQTKFEHSSSTCSNKFHTFILYWYLISFYYFVILRFMMMNKVNLMMIYCIFMNYFYFYEFIYLRLNCLCFDHPWGIRLVLRRHNALVIDFAFLNFFCKEYFGVDVEMLSCPFLVDAFKKIMIFVCVCIWLFWIWICTYLNILLFTLSTSNIEFL